MTRPAGFRLSSIPFKQSANAPTSPDRVRDDATDSDTSRPNSSNSSPRTPTLFQRFVKLVGRGGGSTDNLTEYSPVNDAEIGAEVDEDDTLQQHGVDAGNGYTMVPSEDEGNDSDWY